MDRNHSRDNFLIRGVISGGREIRYTYCGCADAVNGIITAQNCDPAAAELIADAVAATAGLRTNLEPGQRETIRWRYEGCVGNLVAEISADGSLRALAADPRPMSRMSEVTLDTLLGPGAVTLSAVLQAPDGTVLSNSTTETMLREPSEAMAYHLSTSEQVESVILTDIVLCADPQAPVRRAGAVMFQALPGCDPEKFSSSLAGAEAPSPAEDESPEETIRRYLSGIFGNAPVSVYAETPPEFRCGCSSGHFVEAIRALNQQEREELVRGRDELAVTCEFCGRRHRIKASEIL